MLQQQEKHTWERENWGKNLNIKNIIFWMSIDKVVGNPLEWVLSRFQLVHNLHLITVLKDGPRQHSGSVSHRESKFHVVASIIHSFTEIQLCWTSIFDSWITSPWYLVIYQLPSWNIKWFYPLKCEPNVQIQKNENQKSLQENKLREATRFSWGVTNDISICL